MLAVVWPYSAALDAKSAGWVRGGEGPKIPLGIYLIHLELMLLLEGRLNQVNSVQEIETLYLYGPHSLLVALHRPSRPPFFSCFVFLSDRVIADRNGCHP